MNNSVKLSELLSEFGYNYDIASLKEHYNDDDDKEYHDEEYNVDEDININDYIPAEEELEFSGFTNLINIFTCYFKQLFEKKQHATVVDGFDYEKTDDAKCIYTGTNRCMEFMYEEIFKFNKSKEDDKDILYDPDSDEVNIDNCNELYTLYINSEPKFVCKFIVPILQYLSTQEWIDIDWSIIKIK